MFTLSVTTISSAPLIPRQNHTDLATLAEHELEWVRLAMGTTTLHWDQYMSPENGTYPMPLFHYRTPYKRTPNFGGPRALSPASPSPFSFLNELACLQQS